MKIKLNHQQLELIRQGLVDKKDARFNPESATEVFEMLSYWTKKLGPKEAKISAVNEVQGGFLCLVNEAFTHEMKRFLAKLQTRAKYHRDKFGWEE